MHSEVHFLLRNLQAAQGDELELGPEAEPEAEEEEEEDAISLQIGRAHV